MLIKTWGTGGSLPVSNPKRHRFGGNTTCIQIESSMNSCIPKDTAVVIDAGTGIVPLGQELLQRGIKKIWLLFTHWHHDHTQGLLFLPHMYITDTEIRIWGPKEHGIGPNEVFSTLMRKPYFPVEFAAVKHRVRCKDLEHIGTQVLVFNTKGGAKLFPTSVYENSLKGDGKLNFGNRTICEIKDCMIIKMLLTNHPEYTVSYRVEEKPLEKTFVLLTDHENTDGIPKELLRHAQDADMLIMDCQYTRKLYDERTAGFGHATPEYCATLAKKANVKALGLTHHDPGATDEDIEAMKHLSIVSLTDWCDSKLSTIDVCADYNSYVI